MMSEAFDPYVQWLDIPADATINHYRLLGLNDFEADRDTISQAADERMALVKTFQLGQHSELSQRILNELASARSCLLNPTSKSIYDGDLWRLRNEPPPFHEGSTEPIDDGAENRAALGSTQAGAPQVPLAKSILRSLGRTFARPSGDGSAPASDEELSRIPRNLVIAGIALAVACLGISSLVVSILLSEPGDTPIASTNGPHTDRTSNELAELREPTGGTSGAALPASPSAEDENAIVGPPVGEITATATDEKPTDVEPSGGEKSGKQPEAPSLTPPQLLEDAIQRGDVKHTLELIRKHAALQRDGLIEAQIIALERFHKMADKLDAINAGHAARQTLTLLKNSGEQGIKERSLRCLPLIGTFVPLTRDTGKTKSIALDRLKTVRDQAISSSDLPLALEFSVARSRLQVPDVERSTTTVEFLEHLLSLAQQPKHQKLVADFSLSFLAKATDCKDRVFYDRCANVAMTAARRNYLDSGESTLLDKVTETVIIFYEECEENAAPSATPSSAP